MLRITLLFLIILFPFVAISQQENPEAIAKKLQRKFKRDAARLALRDISKNQNEELRYLDVMIPHESTDLFESALSDIYLQHELGKSMAHYNIHTFPNPSIDHFVVIFDENVEWAAPMMDGISETDSEEMNDLMDQYNLIIEKVVQWTDTEYGMTIRTNSPLNMAAISNEFYNFDGVHEIDLGIPKMAGNNISTTGTDSGIEVTYSLVLGSFSETIDKEHHWIFRWDKDSRKVQFIRDFGEPLPNWMKK